MRKFKCVKTCFFKNQYYDPQGLMGPNTLQVADPKAKIPAHFELVETIKSKPAKPKKGEEDTGELGLQVLEDKAESEFD